MEGSFRLPFGVKADMDYERRYAALRKRMSEHGCDLAIFSGCPNYQYLTGDLHDWREAPDHRPMGRSLIVPANGEAILSMAKPDGWQGAAGLVWANFGPSGSFRQWLSALAVEKEPKKIGIGANLDLQTQLALFDVGGGIEFVDASHWLDESRAIKDPDEIEKMRAVAKLTDDAMMVVVRNLADGVSMDELALLIEMEGRRRGASNVSFSPFAGYMKLGEGSPDDITNVPFDQGLMPNTAICFDVGFVLNGYSSDWGRSVYWGKCPSHIRDAYRALVDSMLETVAQLHDGSMRACDVYPAIEKSLDKRGFGDPMRLRLAQHKVMGHSIGVEVHESPWLGPASDFVLREGMTIAIEPKLWVPGEYYLRLEEIVLIGKTSSEFLTNFARSLFEL